MSPVSPIHHVSLAVLLFLSLTVQISSSSKHEIVTTKMAPTSANHSATSSDGGYPVLHSGRLVPPYHLIKPFAFCGSPSVAKSWHFLPHDSICKLSDIRVLFYSLSEMSQMSSNDFELRSAHFQDEILLGAATPESSDELRRKCAEEQRKYHKTEGVCGLKNEKKGEHTLPSLSTPCNKKCLVKM